ncbi:MAG: LytTR family transcriptional regulator DNA-binding domain-containing protein [Bacilli bacterium]|jgi:two-component system response regulator AgrA
MLLDFISKFDDYQKNLYETLQLTLKILDNKKQLIIKIAQTIYKIDFNDILYIVKEEGKRNTIIKTFYQEYSVSLPLTEISEKLSSDFIRTHRACLVNKVNIKTIDFKENVIMFKNDESINLLSKKCKKEVKKYVCS